MTNGDIKGKIPIMSFYFGPVNVGWIYIDPPYFEISTFDRQDIDFTTLTDYYPDLVIMNLHLKKVRHHFADSYIIRIHSKEVKRIFKYIPLEFKSYNEYFQKLLASLYNSKTARRGDWLLAGRRASPAEFKALQQLVYTLYLLEMGEYITYPLLTETEDT